MLNQPVGAGSSEFTTDSRILEIATTTAPQFIDITDTVADFVARSGVQSGLLTVFSRHTTAAIKINESEPELLKDMARFLNEVAPLERDYFHNDFGVRTVNMQKGEDPNAHAHCQHLMLSAGETIPVVEGRMHLGRWQRIFLIELDRAKLRQVTVQIIGT